MKEIVAVSDAHSSDVDRGGAQCEVRTIRVGDDTLSVLDIWGAEYQENDVWLLWTNRVEPFVKFASVKSVRRHR